MKKYQSQSGFTLVEALVYVAVLVIVSSAAVTALISYSDVLSEQKVKRLVTSNSQTALERITRDIRNADSVNVIGSTFGGTTGTLVLNNAGPDSTFEYTSGGINVTTGAGGAEDLVSSEVSVDELTFTHYTTGITELVRIELVISATSSDSTATERFYGAAVLRGSYD